MRKLTKMMLAFAAACGMFVACDKNNDGPGLSDDEKEMKDMSVLQETPFTDNGSVVEVFTDVALWERIRKAMEMTQVYIHEIEAVIGTTFDDLLK